MYVPHHFAETDQDSIRAFIRSHGFGTLVSWDGVRPVATQLLLNLSLGSDSEMVLTGHIAKANPQWKTFTADREVLALFEGPHAYVSAAWYSVQSAPTWNYITVQAYGTIQLVDDKNELYTLLKDLVDKQESYSPIHQRYQIESLSPDILESMMNGIVGFKMKVSKVESAAKLSQNRNGKDCANIISKLHERGDADSEAIAKEMELRQSKLGKDIV